MIMVSKKRVVIIIPPANIGYGYINAFFWQKGVLHLASYIHRVAGDEFEVEIFDGNNRSLDECLNLANDGLYAAGIYCIDHTKDNGAVIIEAFVRARCPKLFLGGPGIINSKQSYYNKYGIMQQETEIMYSGSQGEVDVVAFLKGDIISPDSQNCGWNMEIYDKDEEQLYFKAYKRDLCDYISRQLNDSNYPYPAITYSTLSHLGCVYRVKAKGCSFCGIPHNFHHVINGKLFWHDFENFRLFCHNELGYSVNDVKSIKDWGDSISTEVLGELLQHRPDNCRDVEYNCYLSCRDINEENLELLKKLNCFSVYMGIDGVAFSSLASLNKGYTPEILIKRLELLSKYPFKVEMGLIVGNRNENQKSLDRIVNFAEYVNSLFGDKVIVIQGNVLIPMPGSPLYNELSEQVCIMEGKPDPLAALSVEQRIKKWLQFYTQVSFYDCLNTQHRIELISPRKHSYIEGQ